jgi:hypothetical protein
LPLKEKSSIDRRWASGKNAVYQALIAFIRLKNDIQVMADI